ncbi:MAG: aminotransferase class V-fold PLP-dependent enzyme, partial [Planctomycetes bacterium]|nr:aminotransferase class V-fold PLP-dependent enzyme [Planctomycetota bacterium]
MRPKTTMDSIYLDHNATTPIRPEVAQAMARCYAEGYANPASQHRPGQRARRVLDDAREAIADVVGANLSSSPADWLIFTSGGTEANTLAVLGIAPAAEGGEPGQVIVSAIEHASVIEPAEHLMEQGWRLDTMGVTSEGVVRVERLAGLITPETRLVSVMLANHETGVLQPVAELAPICREAGVPLHTDAVQVAGKLPIDFRSLGVSAMTITAHKLQGPLGIGALILRDDVAVDPILFGGHQQGGVRPGTESVALAEGMRTALELWREEHEAHARR